MPDEDTPDVEGADDAALVGGVATDAPVVEEAPPEPEVYTREQLAEILPHFDQFATHEGVEAFRKYGESYGNARSFISSGAHREPQPPEVYQGIGLDPNEIPEPESDEQAQQIWGAPWEPPASWDEYVAYAQSDSPDQRRLAAYGVLQADGPDQATKQWFYNQWAQADPHGAAAYIQQSTMSAAEQRLADLEARLEARYAATHEDLLTRNATDLMETAKSQVTGFEDHATGVLALWNERCANEPSFAERFLAAPRPEQLKELRRLTIIAAAEAEPQRQAAASAAADQTDAAKLRTRTEASRTGGAPDTDAAALKRQSIDEAKRVFGQVR